MVLEPYYERGGLKEERRVLHKKIFWHLLSEPTGFSQFTTIRDSLLRDPKIKLKYKEHHITFEINELLHRGFLEVNPHIPVAEKHGPALRINPAILDKVYTFVKKK